MQLTTNPMYIYTQKYSSEGVSGVRVTVLACILTWLQARQKCTENTR